MACTLVVDICIWACQVMVACYGMNHHGEGLSKEEALEIATQLELHQWWVGHEACWQVVIHSLREANQTISALSAMARYTQMGANCMYGHLTDGVPTSPRSPSSTPNKKNMAEQA